MSRVYDALLRSQQERGQNTDLLDPEAFTADVAEGPNETIVWDRVATFIPNHVAEARLVALGNGNGLGAEKFRLLRSRLRHVREMTGAKRVVITSAIPQEGKTLIAANLAISMAKHTAQKILLLEGDLHQPALGERVGLGGRAGIGDWARDGKAIEDCLYRAVGSQLWVLPAGFVQDHPLAILQSARFLELFRRLGEVFDWILIDSPPLLPLADANFWSRQSDGLLLVVREGTTPRSLLQKGLEMLDSPTLLGIVMNDLHAVESNYYNRYYSHADHHEFTIQN